MPLNAEEQELLQELMARAAEPPCSEWEIAGGPISGAMTDGSKRRESGLAEGPRGKRLTTTMGSSSAGYMASDAVGTPFLHDTDLKSFDIELPPGVDSFDSWGRTLIDFGKLKELGISYHELYQSTDSVCVDYVKYAKPHAKSSTGHLQDLAKYLVACDRVLDPFKGSQQPVIPGTTSARKLK